jgi:hypothetical protein
VKGRKEFEFDFSSLVLRGGIIIEFEDSHLPWSLA